jgi:hypothetical protein
MHKKRGAFVNLRVATGDIGAETPCVNYDEVFFA